MSEVSFGQMLLFHFGSSVTLAREMAAGRLGNTDIKSIGVILTALSNRNFGKL